MKNFLETLATDLRLHVVCVVDQKTNTFDLPLLDAIDLDFVQCPTTLEIDNMNLLPFVYYKNNKWHFTIHKPFYQWRHDVTGQGWLLKPQ